MSVIKRADVPFREVEAAARAHVADHQDPGIFTVDPAMAQAIGQVVGFDQSMAEYSWERGQKWDRFIAQLRRAFDKMAADALLRKAGAGTIGPHGREVDRRDVRYYTPAAWTAAEQRAAAEAGQRAAEQRRWEAVHAALRGLGLDPRQLRTGEIRLDLDGWEQLAGLAQGGMARHMASEDA